MKVEPEINWQEESQTQWARGEDAEDEARHWKANHDEQVRRKKVQDGIIRDLRRHVQVLANITRTMADDLNGFWCPCQERECLNRRQLISNARKASDAVKEKS